MHLDDGPFHLAVVEVDPGMLERIPDAFLKVVPIPSSGIGWIQIELNLEQARKRLADPPREERANRYAVLSTLAAEERAVAHMPVIPVDARRERQHKSQWDYHWRCPVSKGHSDVPRVSVHVRFHGGLADLAEEAAKGATGAAVTGEGAAPSRFL